MHPLGTLEETKWQNALGSDGRNSNCLPFIMYFTQFGRLGGPASKFDASFSKSVFFVAEAFFAATHCVPYFVHFAQVRTIVHEAHCSNFAKYFNDNHQEHGTPNFSSNFEVVYTQFL